MRAAESIRGARAATRKAVPRTRRGSHPVAMDRRPAKTFDILRVATYNNGVFSLNGNAQEQLIDTQL